MRKKKTIVFVLLICAVLHTACGFRTRTTTIRGYVHSGDQKVSGGEVRLSAAKGGAETTTQIGIDGRFRITLEHAPGARLQVKVLQPGFVHDPIEFNSADAPQNEMDINLKRLFTPTTSTPK